MSARPFLPASAAARGRRPRRRALFAFAAAAVLLHLALLGAIDGVIGDAGAAKPVPAATWLRIRTIAVEGQPAQAGLPVGDPAPPVSRATTARPTSSARAASRASQRLR